jgi:hypothetical protein
MKRVIGDRERVQRAAACLRVLQHVGLGQMGWNPHLAMTMLRVTVVGWPPGRTYSVTRTACREADTMAKPDEGESGPTHPH